MVTTANKNQRYIPIAELAKQWGRSVDHIKSHINAGNLHAINTSVTGKSSEWVVSVASVEAFEAKRSAKPKTRTTRPPAVKRPKNHFEPKSQPRTNSDTASNRPSSTE